MAKNDIVVDFVSDSQGDMAIAKQGNRENKNVSQKDVIEMLQKSVGEGTFISGKVQRKDDKTQYRYTLKEDDDKKGTIVINTSFKYHGEEDVNINELEAISERGNSIKYWDKTKMVATCVLVGGIALGVIGITGYGTAKVIYEMDKAEQEYQQDDYVAELNQARAENGATPIGWTEEDQIQFVQDKVESNNEYDVNDSSYQFGDYFEEEQAERGKRL